MVRLRSPGAAAAAALLVSGCAFGRVGEPPPPPDYRPPARAEPAEPPSAATLEPTRAAAPVPSPAPARDEPPAAPPELAPPAAEAQPPASPAPPAKPASTPLGWIAGEPLAAEEFLLEWGDAASREMWMVLDKLVAARLALAEADRLGIRLAPEAVEARFVEERGKLEREIAREGKERSLEEFIERELGFEPERYLERVRRATIRQMLAERAVRAASLAGESVALRLIVASAEGQAAVQAALDSGRDFADVARELSVDDSRKNGGLVPFLVPEERSPLARLAFETPVGEIAGPLPVADHQFWIRVEERRAPVQGDWAAVEAAVEGSLVRSPVGDAEFVHWRLTMERRYPIDLGPLWSLTGAAR